MKNLSDFWAHSLCLLSVPILFLLMAPAVDAGKIASVSYRLPYIGIEQTYRVTIAAAPADDPDWLVSTFVAGAVRTVNAENQGEFTENWNGLDDNFMPVSSGEYIFKGIYSPAQKWRIDGQYHSLIPEFVSSPGDSWAPVATQDHRMSPIHGHVFEPIYDIAIQPNGKAVFLSGYVENWRNPFLVDLKKPVGIDQVLQTWSSSGRSGGQHVAYDSRDIWMIRFNEVYCHTNSNFGTTRTRRGRMVASLGTHKTYPSDIAVAEGKQRSILYISEPENRRITVLDGNTGKLSQEIENIEASALIVANEDTDQYLYALNRVGSQWLISHVKLGNALPVGDWKGGIALPDGPTPRGLAYDQRGIFYVIRGRQVLGYDRNGQVQLAIGKNKKLEGPYDDQVLVHPGKLAAWVDEQGTSRLTVTETGGPMRVSEWSLDDGSLLRQWFLCQNAGGGYCIDPENPSHLYATSLNTPELLQYSIDYRTGSWKVERVWEGICHRNMETQFPGGRMFPQLINYQGHKYLCFAGGAFRAYGGWMVYRQHGSKWRPSAAYVNKKWWHDANGDGQKQDNEFLDTQNQGVGSYWAGKFLDDLSILEIPKRGHAVRRLKPVGFDSHGNPIYQGDDWQDIATDTFAAAIAKGKSNELDPNYGGNELGNQFWDWSDATVGEDGALYVAGVYKPDGITGYKYDEAGQVCAQWKLTKWGVYENGKRQMQWRVGRKAFGVAKPGEVYATMHISAPSYGLLGIQDGNGLYHVFTTEGLYVDTLMYDRFRFGNMARGGMYVHSGGSYFGRHFLNSGDGQVYVLMGRASNNIYRVPQWTPGVVKTLPIKTTSFEISEEQIASVPKHVLDLRKSHDLPIRNAIPEPDSNSANAKAKLAIEHVTTPFDENLMMELSHQKPIAAKAEFYPVGFNIYTGDQRQKTPVINGKPCPAFIFAHAPSIIVYAVPSGYKKFTALGTSLNKQDFAFIVRGDGKELLRTQALHQHGGNIPIEVNLPEGTQRLELIVDDLKSPRADHAIWAYPRLLK